MLNLLGRCFEEDFFELDLVALPNDILTVIKTYDWFTAIKSIGSSTFSFLLLHLLSYIFFKKKLVF